VKNSQISKISKINIPLLIIAIVSIFAFAATKAYFTASADSPDNVFLSGTLDLAIGQDNILTGVDWRPGGTYSMEFNLENTGSMPINVKGYLGGEWGLSELDPNMVEVVLVEKFGEFGWEQLNENNLAISEEFLNSSDGTEGGLSPIFPQEIVPFRIMIKLKETTTDEYQNQTFSANLHIAGRQVNGPADWPAEY